MYKENTRQTVLAAINAFIAANGAANQITIENLYKLLGFIEESEETKTAQPFIEGIKTLRRITAEEEAIKFNTELGNRFSDWIIETGTTSKRYNGGLDLKDAVDIMRWLRVNLKFLI